MIAAALLAGLWACPAAASPAALDRAIQAELGRAKRELKAEGYPGIYYAALTVWDLDDWEQWSVLGAAGAQATSSQRIVLADVRVGSPSLDNHAPASRGDNQGTLVSLSDDEFALRHSLWRPSLFIILSS